MPSAPTEKKKRTANKTLAIHGHSSGTRPVKIRSGGNLHDFVIALLADGEPELAWVAGECRLPRA